MSHFSNSIKTLDELKTAYHNLAFKNHPDLGGDVNVMQEINAEYDVLYAALSITSHCYVTQTAAESRSEFYTANGWKGCNYNRNLYNKDIAVLLRSFVKKAFPTCKFSIRSDSYTINVDLMKADFNPCAEDFELSHGTCCVHKYDGNSHLSEYGAFVFKKIVEFLDSYRYDDSDSMIDYFDTNFYFYMGIGRYGKPFVQTANNHYAAMTDIVAA